jgi:hypothetical protein
MFETFFDDPCLHCFQHVKVEMKVMNTTKFILAKVANVVYLYFNFFGGIR